MKRRIGAWSALLFAVMLVAAACGGGGGAATGGASESEASGQAPAPAAVVGILLPATGDLGSLGQPMIKGAQLGYQVINDAGGVWGQPLEVKTADDGTDENKAHDAMQQLINLDKVSAIVGSAGSGISQAVLNVAKPANVAMCSPASTSPAFTTMDDGGLFVRTAASDALQGAVAAQVAYEEGYRKAAVIALNNPYGSGFAGVFKDTFTKLGGQMALDPVLYDPKGSDFTGEVQRIAQAKPDVVELIGYPDTGSIILQEAYQAGLISSAHWILSEGMKDETLSDKVGKDPSGKPILAGVEGTAPSSSQGPAYSVFQKQLAAVYSGENPEGPFVSNSYDCAVLIGLALEKVGPEHAHDGKAIAQAIIDVASPPGQKVSDPAVALHLVQQGEEIDFDGASGSLDMDQVGDIVSATYEVWTIDDNGKIQHVKDITPGQ
ncbi:MAG: ABC transporter substrate-binding protein [Clostridia bacterium]|nr:ABC transporter substrate-binding protein [Clostridia bacterium]